MGLKFVLRHVFNQENTKDGSSRTILCVHSERVMGLEPTNNGLGSHRLTTWQHPRKRV